MVQKLVMSLSLVGTLMAVGCAAGGGGGGGGGRDPVVTASSFIDRLNAVDPRARFYTIQKPFASDPNYFVFYDARNDRDMALDIVTLQQKGFTAREAVSAYLNGTLGFSTDLERASNDTPAAIAAFVASGFTEEFWEGRDSGFLYDDTNGAWSSDLETNRAILAREFAVVDLTEKLMTNIGLTNDEATEGAQALLNWRDVQAAGRALTESDLSKITMEFAGVPVGQMAAAANASARGDNTLKEKLLETAATYRKQSVSETREIMNRMTTVLTSIK